MRRALFAAALLLLSASARADERMAWSAELGVGDIWLGPAERPTGGLSIVGGARYSWPIGERASFDAGLSIESFGFASGSKWMGLIGGPSIGATAKLSDSWSAGISGEVPYGRVPVCNEWGLCLRFWGLYPGGATRVTYAGSMLGVTASVAVRYVDTIAWRGASVEPVVAGTVRW